MQRAANPPNFVTYSALHQCAPKISNWLVSGLLGSIPGMFHKNIVDLFTGNCKYVVVLALYLTCSLYIS